MNIISCLNHCNNLQIHPLILSLAPLKFIFYITATELFLNFQLKSMLFLILKILSGFYTALKMKSKFLIFSYKIPIEIFSPWRLCMMDSFYFLLQIQISRWEQSHQGVYTLSYPPAVGCTSSIQMTSNYSILSSLLTPCPFRLRAMMVSDCWYMADKISGSWSILKYGFLDWMTPCIWETHRYSFDREE